MMKYFLGILSTLVSFLLGAVALAGDFTLHATNLPLVQSYAQPLPIELSLSTPAFSGANQKATLAVDNCGKTLEMSYQGQPVANLPLTLAPETTYDFLFMVEKETTKECVLNFSLLNTEKEKLATTQVVIMPSCTPKYIDEGLYDNELPAENTDEQAISSLDSDSSNSSSNISSTTPSKPVSSNPSFATPLSLVNPAPAELDTAFSLLVEKGLLTAEDKTKLFQPLTRIVAAELFVKIALSKGYDRDTKKDCSFADMTDSTEYDINIARLACEFNIMGINPNHTPIPEFLPSMTIPSEQLATAFSRLMWRELYENPETTEYYQLHMNTLYNLGIIDAIAVHSPSTLADFAVILSRSVAKEQISFPTVEAELNCDSETSLASACKAPEKKDHFRFW
ncbi:MAG: hypothetical protein LBD11_03080 [Candidatus Peribacteria bacterium]|nr:hypothetical protein [Candidatus Peribacteria bacterium]